MPYYAQINEARFVYSVTEASGVIDSPDMISIDYLNLDLLGMTHDAESGEFSGPED